MSLLITLLSGAGGGGGGSGSVTGIILTPVVAASTTALTVTYANGSSGVGATLTNAGAQAAITLDGQSPTVGQRVLIKNQAAPAQNGIYTVTTVGTGATNWVLTRATDFDQASEMTAGTLVEVVNGTVNAGTIWQLSTTVATVGTTALTFVSINITTKVDQNGSPIYGVSTTGNDTYVITLSPAPAAYTAGMVINFNADVANTGNATLNVNALGAKNILKAHDQTLADNDIEAGQLVTVIYDGTQFQMQSQLGATPATGTVTQVTGGGIATGTVTTTGSITVTAATQAVQETGSSTTAAVVPGVQQFHASAAKSWCFIDNATGINASYNVTSNTDNGTGDHTITFTVNMSSSNYCVYACAKSATNGLTTGVITAQIVDATFGANTYRIQTSNASGALIDPTSGYMSAAYGDQ